MSTIRESLSGYRAALLLSGAAEVRLKMSMENALSLTGELSDEELRFPNEVRAASAMLAAHAETTEPGGFDEKLEWMQTKKRAVDAFWSAFAGEVVDGVEIVRGEA